MWDREHHYAMKYVDEIQDWAARIMVWNDVKAWAKRVREPSITGGDPQKDWTHSRCEIIEL